ncbi:Protein of unknown function [Bacillus cereus]|uniref:Uncharacterized protein n=2 Tax=Bacillus cereus group TaxID=86661 RepID=A0A1C4DE44_9BACI|nr:Protein of unknown function [Bacillus wiedmannii]SCC26764.1 Protein of unknown function [Bacillus thuringiensis]SCC29619.1 Protein of unknown function [Bacillus cereus]SCC36759.1 Protein of unknown function [Bacillus wiedmannii]SCL94500.1 Protein of unknown function [Bacillus wiedmannii]
MSHQAVRFAKDVFSSP